MRRTRGTFGAMAVLVAACSPAPVSNVARAPAFEPENQTKALVAKSSLRPLIIDWSGQDIALLEGQSKTGLVAVKYAPDTRQVELLSSCHADGSYRFVSTTRQDEQLTLHDRAELRAHVALGAGKLEADLARAGQLVVKTRVVGLRTTDRMVTRADLKGEDCGGATHVVKGISVGAFRVLSGADARAAAGAGAAFIGGVNGALEASRETDSRGGDERACEGTGGSETAPPRDCSSPLRIELAEILEEKPLAKACDGDTVWNGTACVPRVATDRAPRARSEIPGVSKMVRVPGGAFVMGSAEGDPFDGPAHGVTVAPFDMDVTEVTTQSYGDCVAARRCAAPQALSPRCNWGKRDRQNHPINCVRWEEARDYCAFVGKRLPTEQEWEFAARGTENRAYPWGASDPGQRGCWSGRNGTCEVGTYPDGKSPFGVLDMAGNVAEWTSTQACGYDGNRCQDAYVYRGGSWFSSDAKEIRATTRAYRGPIPRDDVGVRCVKDAQ